MQNKRIKFTSYERSILRDTDFLLSKRIVTAKMEEMWMLLKVEIEGKYEDGFFHKILDTPFQSAKISKGENYKGLPYVALDCPKYYTRENIFAYRSMCWWGHYFIFTLLLQGKPLENARQKIAGNYSLLKNKNIFFETGNSMWDYDVESGSWSATGKKNENEIRALIAEKPFFKIARIVSFDSSAEKVIEFGKGTFHLFTELLR